MSRSPARRSARPAVALSIGALARATGVPVQTLRTWESRYGAPVATRKPSGHRVYGPEAVELVRRVARLLALGHRPADVFARPFPELDEMLVVAGARIEGPAAAPKRSRRRAALDLARTHERLLVATREFDRPALAHELREAWAASAPLEFLTHVAGAFLAMLGDRWSDGALDVRHEHFASACVFDVLRELSEPLDANAKGPRATLAALPGEQHEGGLRLAATLLAVHGWRVTWLGANTPVAEIAAAARTRGTSAVLVSASAASDPARTKRALAKLREALPARMPLWLGGAGAPAVGDGIDRLGDLSELEAKLGELA